MVSVVDASLSLSLRVSSHPSSDRKRKRQDDAGDVEAAAKELRLWCDGSGASSTSRPVASVELELDDSAPLPPEWQRCLDMKSGRIHFYNTRTREKTTRDPRREEAKNRPPPGIGATGGLDLDLDLNLGCEPTASGAEEGDARMDGAEMMMAGVCPRCHMLVMICRSAPSCPNCKLAQEKGPVTTLFKPGFRLLCCKD